MSAAAALLALPPALAATYLLVLAIASFRRLSPRQASPTWPLLVALVPAHDEEPLIGRCVTSLRDQAYPEDRFRIVVIADNCEDRTAAVARANGAEALERREPDAPGKGRALRWAMDQLLAEECPPDGIVVVDADSIADRQLLLHLGRALAAGADVAQAEYLVLADPASSRSRIVAAAFLLFHRVRFGGRAALGLPAFLVGNGMLLGRRLLEAMPWDAFTGVEDLEYTISLRLAGYRPRYVGAARVLGPVPHGYRAMRGQRLRWEGGRWHVVRARLGALLRGGPRVLDAAVDLAVPPLGLLAMATAAGAAVVAAAAALHLVATWSLAPWAFALAALAGFVLIGLWSADAPLEAWLALLEAPRFLLWKALTYARIARGHDARRWERAERDVAAPEAGPAERVEIAGVPIDRVDSAAALERLRYALTHRRQAHVATVNLDFLVRAQRHAELRVVLQSCELNVADGWPVVWLSRLLGRPVPGRVAGADLVPQLMAEAAACGASVFLLGGEHGTAEAATRTLARMWPELRIAGWHEPPRASLEALDAQPIAERIASSGAEVLLVALGNPKQELWIARHRAELPQVAVAVGVGCVFDLWAGRARRAPRWMRRIGLEWLHRMLAEPRRLMSRYATDGIWLVVLAGTALVQRAYRPLS